MCSGTAQHAGYVDSDTEGHDNPYAGNEQTPILLMPKEVLGHIFEKRMEDFRRTNVYDANRYRKKTLEQHVGRPTLQRDIMAEEEERDRSIFLHGTGQICRAWMSVTGPMYYRAVHVHGHPSDYERAIKKLESGFPGVDSERKGYFVRELSIDFNADYVDEDFIKKVVNVMIICPNVQKLVFRGDGLTRDEVGEIWQDGLAKIAASLVFLEWTCFVLSGRAIGSSQYLGLMTNLTQLELEEQDAVYEFEGWDKISLPVLEKYNLKTKHSSIMRYQAKWGLYSLEHFIFTMKSCAKEDENYDDEGVDQFFKCHGNGLKSLEIKEHPRRYGVIQSILDATPCLDQLAIDVDVLNLKSSLDRCIHHDNLRLLYITGVHMSLDQSTTVASNIAGFLKSMREDQTYPSAEVIKVDSSHWQMCLDEVVLEEWLSWFKIEISRRPIIIDSNNDVINLQALSEFIGADKAFRRRQIVMEMH